MLIVVDDEHKCFDQPWETVIGGEKLDLIHLQAPYSMFLVARLGRFISFISACWEQTDI